MLLSSILESREKKWFVDRLKPSLQNVGKNPNMLNGYWEVVTTFNINSSIAFMHFFLKSTLAHILELTDLFYKHCAFKQ